MKKPKLNCPTGRFAVSLLIATFLAGIFIAKAQNAVYVKPMKYELNIDLVPVIPYSTEDIHYYTVTSISGPSVVCPSGANFTIDNPGQPGTKHTC